MKKLFWEIFPKNKEEWEWYFDWCINYSKMFYPIGKTLNVCSIVILLVIELFIHVLLIMLFPLMRIELRICANSYRKQKRKEQND